MRAIKGQTGLLWKQSKPST